MLININKLKRVGSHKFILESVIEILDIKGILELGCGLISTPLFINSGIQTVSIETDKNWIEEVTKIIPKTNIVYQDFVQIELNKLGLNNKSRPLPEYLINKCIKSYKYEINKFNPNLLFVDQITGLRTPSILALYKFFDIIIFHDSDVAGYMYDKLKIIKYPYIRIDYKYLIPWTSVLINTDIFNENKIVLLNKCIKNKIG